MHLPIDTVIHHRYAIRRQLGQGAMGASYLAWDLLRETSVTLKILRACQPELLDAFRTEFSRLRGVVHPHLPQVHDFGGIRRDDGSLTYFYSADYIDGTTLDRYVQGRPWAEAAKPIAHALDGLRFLHRLNVRHGDFKPENILVNGDGAAALIDLGCSQPIEAAASASVSGTPGFLAPELLSGETADHRADLYAVGATLERIAPSLSGQLPKSIVRLTKRLLQKRPIDRPSDAQEVLDELAMEITDMDVPCLQPARLLGRAGETAAFDEILRSVLDRRDGPRGLLVIGPDGVGRTRLLQEMKWSAQLRCAVVEGHAARALPVLSMLRRATRDPALARDIGGVLHARELLAASPEPIALILDDTHLAPQPEQELLYGLLRSLEPSDPFIIVCSGLSPPPLSSSCVRVMTLEPLDETEVAEWAVDSVPRRRVADVMRLTGGFPASVHALLSLLRTGDRAERSLNPLGGKAPLSERRIASLHDLDNEQRRMLGLFAVIDGPLDNADVMSLDGGREALGRLVHRGFVQAGPAGFKLVRAGEAVGILGTLSADVVLALHAQAADRLRERLASGINEPSVASELTARLVHHLCLGGLVERARSLLSASRHLYNEHPAAFALAAEVVAAAHPTPDLLLLAAEIHEAAGHFKEALSLVARLLRTRPSAAMRARARVQAGASYLRLGSPRRALHSLIRALAEAPGVEERARALDLISRAHIKRGAYAEALACARRGLEAEPNASVMADLNDAIGLAASYLGDVETARVHLRVAARLHEETGNRRAQARSADYQALNEFRAGNTLAAAQGYRAALEIAERHGTSRHIASAVLNLGTACHQLGDLGQALSSYERALRMAIALGLVGTEATLRYNLAKLYADIGLFDRAEAAAERAETVAREAGARPLLGAISTELGTLATLRGDLPRAFEHLARARSELAAQAATREVIEVDIHLAEAHLAARDRAEAERALARAAASISTLRADDLAARLAMVRGRVALEQERAADALEHLEEAWRLAQEAGQRILQAEVLERLASACEQEGAAFLAQRHRGRARELWERVAASLPRRLRGAFWAHPIRSGRRDAEDPPRAPSVRERKLERLLDINKKLNSLLDVNQVLSCALDSAIELTGSERGFVILASKEGDGGALHVAVARNMDHERINKSQIKFSSGIAEQVISTAQPVTSVNAQEDPRFCGNESVHAMRLQSVISVPIRSPEGVLGALYLDHRFRKALFNADDMDLLMAFADQVAIALTNARRGEELERRGAELLAERKRIEQLMLGQAEEIDRLTEKVRETGAAREHRYDYSRIIGRSAAMQRVFTLLDRFIGSPVNVLIQGESGTGKELVARAIHDNGPRPDGPFVAVNCGAVPEALLESELFGHVRGSFTGATRDQPGLFGAARGGTLFLDEIGEMPLIMQVKLLRVLEEREMRPVGSSEEIRLDIRLVCATNRRLRDEVDEGRFRPDLFYRICGVEIVLPPLRQRMEDIPALAEHILDRVPRGPSRSRPTLSCLALQMLESHPWPGNVRELDRALTSAVMMTDGDVITPADLRMLVDADLRSTAAPTLDRRRLADQKAARIVAAFNATGGNISEVCRRLGIPRQTFYRKYRLLLNSLGRSPQGALRPRPLA